MVAIVRELIPEDKGIPPFNKLAILVRILMGTTAFWSGCYGQWLQKKVIFKISMV